MSLIASDDSSVRSKRPFVKRVELSLNRTRRLSRSKVIAVLVIGLAFFSGFGAAVLVRPGLVPPVEAKIQVSDFRVPISEGETTVTIASRDNGVELGRLSITRTGDSITGVPVTERRIPARTSLTDQDLAFFRSELSRVYNKTDGPWDRANKIRRWLVRLPHNVAMPGLVSRNPREAYEQMRAGQPVLCGNLADIYAALCEAAGLTSRTVGLSVAVQNGSFGIDTHAGAEVWISELGGWVYEDPTFDCYWQVNGKPAGAFALHEAVMTEQPIEYLPREKSVEEKLRSYYIDPRLYFRHISFEYKPGGAVLYFADKRLEPLSLTDKNWVHTSESIDIQRLDAGGNLVFERKEQIAPGVFVQLLGDDLFIRDRRERGAGLKVRSTSGAVEGCAYLHQRAEDLRMFQSANLVNNPAFRMTKGSNQIADGWSVGGPIEAMSVSGGQAMSALAGGRLWQRIPAQPNKKYLMYARVSVSRGFVNWFIGDSSKPTRSMGTVEPERISEVVSDVVESDSGYLDVGFDLPAGGAFRVMDVIVSEAPRFSSNATELTRKE